MDEGGKQKRERKKGVWDGKGASLFRTETQAAV